MKKKILFKVVGVALATFITFSLCFIGFNSASADTYEYTIETLSTTLPEKVSDSTSSTVGDKIYIFGGSNGFGYFDTINVFDTTTNTIETLSTTLPTNLVGSACSAVGNKIYIFGGTTNGYASTTSNLIYIFDTTTNTIETLSTTLPNPTSEFSSSVVGDKIYLFGGSIWDGSSSSYTDTINVFDTTTNTIETLSTTLPKATISLTSSTLGDKIYLFGGTSSNLINIFDTTTNTIETLSTTLPTNIFRLSSSAVGDKIYLFGGTTNGATMLNTINVFDTSTNTIETLSTTLPTTLQLFSCSNVGDKIYLFGGRTGQGSGTSTNTIKVFTVINTTPIPPITTTFFESLTSILSGFTSFMVSLFTSVIGVFFVTNGDSLEISTMGYILFLGVVVSIFWFILGWIRRLLTLRSRG